MKNTTHIIFITLFSIFIITKIAAQKLPPMVSDSIFYNNEKMNNWLAENKIAALGIGVIEQGELREIRMLGNLKENQPAPHNAIFNVASLTKPVVAMLTLKLVSEGQWDLDEPVAKYWIDPDVVDDPRHKQITTRHLLTHQAGFPNWRYGKFSDKLKFKFDPGKKHSYSGEGFEYLREALERKFGKPIEVLADSLLFRPLGMMDTHFIWRNEVDEKRYAHPHDANGGVYDLPKRTHANAADDLLTTIEDYGKFLVYILEQIETENPIIMDMIKPQVETKKGKAFGLGWEIYPKLSGGEYAISHGGSDRGVQTLVILLPKSQKGLIIFTNSDDSHKKIYPTLVMNYLGKYGKEIFGIELQSR